MKNSSKWFSNNLLLLPVIILVFIFFYQFILHGKIPIPADTIVGMYYPWKDVVWDNYQSGVPFKNFLITDPIRQQYVWRQLAFNEIRSGNLPLWNPYSFSGTPLLANFQSAVFYPLNFLFIIFPFSVAWGILVMLQPMLAGIFLYLYLRHLKLNPFACLFGAVSYSFSGFMISWLEWNTIGHVVLWLPLILLAIEKIFLPLSFKNLLFWSFIFIFSLLSSFFAGHLQIFFYSFLTTIIYLVARIISFKQNKIKTILLFIIYYLLFIIITSVQWLPTFKYIELSARGLDQNFLNQAGWFIPWQNLIQFIAPDFFGNPATLNYWGVWNYGEFIGYVGIFSIFLSLYALFFIRRNIILFLGLTVFFGLLFSLPTPIAKLPYVMGIPFVSSSQPTRLIFIVDFGLAVLTAFGLDSFLKKKELKCSLPIVLFLGLIILGLWLFVINYPVFNLSVTPENMSISKRNILLPTILFVLLSMLIYLLTKIKSKTYITLLLILFFILHLFDLFRFGWKFTPFTKNDWIFPRTQLLDILKEKSGYWRFLSVDRRIMPPNFSIPYSLLDVSGYDPLYLKNYGRLITAWERGKPDISDSAFNRIITPVNYESFITDLLGVKFIMSMEPLESSKLSLVASYGKTYLYENERVFPRAFLAEEVIKVDNLQNEIDAMFTLGDKLRAKAVIQDQLNLKSKKITPEEFAEITKYEPNQINISVSSIEDRLLVLTDIYHPLWQVYVDGKKDQIYRVDYILRGVVVPSGSHKIEFKAQLL